MEEPKQHRLFYSFKISKTRYHSMEVSVNGFKLSPPPKTPFWGKGKFLKHNNQASVVITIFSKGHVYYYKRKAEWKGMAMVY